MEQPRYHLEGVVRAKTEIMEDFDGPLDVILLLLSKNRDSRYQYFFYSGTVSGISGRDEADGHGDCQ